MKASSGVRPDFIVFLLVMAAAIIPAGCDSPAIETSSSTDSVLVVILSDLYLVEADVQLLVASIPDSTRAAQSSDFLHQTAVRDSILQTHGLTEALFQEYIAPYLSQPEELQQLYDRVLDRLNLERQQVQEP